jgi:transcriptional regulator with XRE-family HTH domain
MTNQDDNRAKFIGGQIKSARESAGMSQMELAKELDFGSATAISLIESGDRKVTAENLDKIARVLQRDIKFFLGSEQGKVDSVAVALRADKDLSDSDRDAILRFVELAKQRHHGKG